MKLQATPQLPISLDYSTADYNRVHKAKPAFCQKAYGKKVDLTRTNLIHFRHLYFYYKLEKLIDQHKQF